MRGCLSHAPCWGPGLQPRHVPWLGIEPATLWFAGQCSICWATLARAKGRERFLKAAREKETVTYQRLPIRLAADFSKETLQARRGWQEVFQVMEGKDLHPRLLYPAKLSFRMEEQVKCLPDKLKELNHHQALIIWNVKGTYLRKIRRSKL